MARISAKQWATELYEAGATLDQVYKEINSALFDPNSGLGCEVIAEYTGLMLDNMEWK